MAFSGSPFRAQLIRILVLLRVQSGHMRDKKSLNFINNDICIAQYKEYHSPLYKPADVPR